MQRVFIDTNVALDLLQNRQPFAGDALYIFALAEQQKIELCLSTDSLSTIFYIIERDRNAIIAKEAITKLLDYVVLCSLDESAVLRGMTLGFADIEDAFICAVALASHANVIVTRNGRDFSQSPLPVLSPCEFVAAYKAQNGIRS